MRVDRFETTRVPAKNVPSVGREQLTESPAHGPLNRIDNHVEPAFTDEGPNRIHDIASRVVHGVFGAEGAAMRSLLLASHQRDDAGASCDGELQARGAKSAGGAGDEHSLAALDSTTANHRVVRGVRRNDERRR